MQNIRKELKTHAFSQFRLTNDLLQNLYKHKITPTAKLVLLYLSSCYNPRKADMFPKQKTIAVKLGISEASVIRAISELHKEGLIISERKSTLRYKFTSKIVSEQSSFEKNFEPHKLQEENQQNESLKTCNLQPHDIEPMREHKNEPLKVEDYRILKSYVQKRGAKNLNAYINKLISSGSAKDIIKEAKQIQANAKAMLNSTQEVLKNAEYASANRAVNVPKSFFDNVRLNCSNKKNVPALKQTR